MNALADSLQRAIEHLSRHPATQPLTTRLAELQQRLETGHFHLAVLGQFKRGKSTLLNALLGEPLLPMGVVPVTAIPALIAYGPTRQARIHFGDGTEQLVTLAQLADYVTEAANPHNERGVARVEVQHPAPLLARGVVLIDTPGIGSTLAHNTETTLAFLSEVDAALFLVSADPPLTAVELEFLRAVRQRARRLFFLLNKVDYLTPPEQAEALHFLQATLQQAGIEDGDLQIFPVSARLALEARVRQDDAGWAASGLGAVEERLEQFLQAEKQATLHSAIRDKAANVLTMAQQLLQTERRALTMPLAELQEKRNAFQQALLLARRQRQQAADMLQGDHKRFLARINQQAAALRVEAEQVFNTAVADFVSAAANLDEAEAAAQQRLREEIEAFFGAQYQPFSQGIQAELTALLTTYVNQADALVHELRHLAADLFAFTFAPLHPDEPPTRMRTPYWVHSALMGGLGLAASPGLWERLLPAAKRRERILNRLRPLAQRLALRNTENLRWAVVQNTEQVMRQFQAHLDARWQETIEATAQVLETAVAQRTQQSAASAADLARLDQLAETIDTMIQELATREA